MSHGDELHDMFHIEGLVALREAMGAGNPELGAAWAGWQEYCEGLELPEVDRHRLAAVMCMHELAMGDEALTDTVEGVAEAYAANPESSLRGMRIDGYAVELPEPGVTLAFIYETGDACRKGYALLPHS
jgi:hypothetical protein